MRARMVTEQGSYKGKSTSGEEGYPSSWPLSHSLRKTYTVRTVQVQPLLTSDNTRPNSGVWLT